MPQKKRAKPPVGKKICRECGKEKSLSQFYVVSSSSPSKMSSVSSDGKTYDICKSCIKTGSCNSDGTINVEMFKQKLMLMDKPYVPEALDSAIKEVQKSVELGKGRTDIIGCYFKNIVT